MFPSVFRIHSPSVPVFLVTFCSQYVSSLNSKDSIEITEQYPYLTQTKQSYSFFEGVMKNTIFDDTYERIHGGFDYSDSRYFRCTKDCPAGQSWNYKISNEYDEIIILKSFATYTPEKNSYLMFLEMPGALPYDIYEFTLVEPN